MMNRVTVRVPASVSNLGPGFDCLGVALRLYNFVTATRTTKREALPAILNETAKVFFRESGARQFGFSLSVKENLRAPAGWGAALRFGLGCSTR